MAARTAHSRAQNLTTILSCLCTHARSIAGYTKIRKEEKVRGPLLKSHRTFARWASKYLITTPNLQARTPRPQDGKNKA